MSRKTRVLWSTQPGRQRLIRSEPLAKPGAVQLSAAGNRLKSQSVVAPRLTGILVRD